MSGFNRMVIRNHFRAKAKKKNAKRKRGAPRTMMGNLWRAATKIKFRINGMPGEIRYTRRK